MFGRIPLLMVVLALSVFFLGGCGDSDKPGPGPDPDPVKAGLVTVSGQVVDSVPAKAEVPATARSSAMRVSVLSAGAGLEGVEVDASSDGFSLGKAETEKNGFFALEVPVPSNGRLVLTFSKAGRITYQKALNVAKDESHSVHAVLPKVDTKTVSPDGVVSGDAIRIDSLPAGEEITLFTGDPTDETGRAVFPGDYMASTPEEGDVGLVSMAFFEAKFTGDAAGAKSTSLEAPAKVRMLLPEGYQDGTLKNPATGEAYKVDDTIEWWSYDTDMAMWVQEDANPWTPEMEPAMIYQGNAALGEDPEKLYVEAWVTHFSWWNADYPQEFAYFCVRVVDGDGNPLENVPVFSRGVTYMNTSRAVRTDKDGWAKGIVVKKSASDAKPTRERAQVFATAGNVEFVYDATDPDEGVVASDELYTPFDEDECKRTDKRPSIELNNTIVVSFEGTVKGKVTNDAGKALVGINVYSSTGGVATTNASGEYSLKVPVGADVMIFVAGVEGKNAKVTDKGTPVVVDFKVPNRPPVITKFSRTPEGQIPSGGVVTFTGEAVDPERGAVTYKWTATAGRFATDTNPTAIWTAPSTFQGAAQVTLTATDADGKSSQMTVPVAWGPLPRPGRLIVTLLDEGKPVAGAPVVLHKPDGSVEREIRTNALGKADFGEIGRDKATVSYGIETSQVYNPGTPWETTSVTRSIRTVVDGPAAAIVVEHSMEFGEEGGAIPASVAAYPFIDGETPLYRVGVGVDLDDIPVGGHAAIQPLNVYFYNNVGPVMTTPAAVVSADVNVYDHQIQNDGKLTLLGMVGTYTEGHAYTLQKWGALYDQVPVSGDLYTMEFDRNPVAMTWTANRNINVFSLTANRKDVEYRMGSAYSSEGPMGASKPRSFAEALAARAARRGALLSAPSATSGSLQIPSDFGADFFYYNATGTTVVSPDVTITGEMRKVGSSTPASVEVVLPDYFFSGVKGPDFTADRKMEWRLETTNDFDVLIASLNSWEQTPIPTASAGAVNVSVDWSVLMAGAKGDGSLVFPKLPNSLEDWLKDGEANYRKFLPQVTVFDFSNVTGFDALLTILFSGTDPDKETIRVLRGTSMLELR